jgi:16S rRNA (guanine527-N7)-methyltransferase
MEIIRKYFPGLPESRYQQLEQLFPLYSYWNQRINVISRKDIANLFTHHVLHALAIAKFISFPPGSTILDAGTGGGFPGIPLAILFPESTFTLLDSVRKKIKVVDDISVKTGLMNVHTVCTRMEDYRGRHHFIVSRAVASFPVFCRYASKNLLPGDTGIIYLKGGDLEKEMGAYAGKVRIIPVSAYFEEAYFSSKKIIFCPSSACRPFVHHLPEH